LAARFRTGVAAAAAEKDSEVLLASMPLLQQPTAAAGDALARPSPVRFTVEPQSASIKPLPERPQAAAAGGKLSLDTGAGAAVLPPEDLVEFNREDSEVHVVHYQQLSSFFKNHFIFFNLCFLLSCSGDFIFKAMKLDS
jgi:hypothetical protein